MTPINKNMENYWKTMLSKENHVYPKGYWEYGALHNAEDCILSGSNEESFWNRKVEIEGLNKNMIFLDIGCGIGRIAKSVAPLVKKYYGVDFSSNMIQRAKEIFSEDKNVFFYVNNGIDLDLFENEKFDVVYITLVFQHMQREIILNYIKEIYRVLKKEGIFFANAIPKIEAYRNGLNKEEIEKAIKKFEILKFQETKCYYNIKCRK